MTTESQMVALFTWFGWTEINKKAWDGIPPGMRGQLTAITEVQIRGKLPPLTLDLMHEAVRHLRYKAGDQFQWLEYTRQLFQVIWERTAKSDDCVLDAPAWDVIEATKEQRLEAFLRTIGKYIES